MKRILVIAALLLGLSTGAAAQTRVGVALTFGDPHFAGQIMIGRPLYPRYSRSYYYRYRPRFYREPRVIVVRPYRYHNRRYHRSW